MMTHWPWKFLRPALLVAMIAAVPGWGQGLLTRVKVTPSDSTAGMGAIYTIKFRTSLTGSGIPATGKIRIKFPPTFTDSTVVAVLNDSGLTSGYSAIKDTNHVLTLTRDGLGNNLAPGDSAQIKLAIVYNSTVADTFRLFIETLTAANVRIDSAKSPVFKITHRPLHHFTIANILTPPTAGVNFNLTISARDVYENVVKSFADTVTFSANQGAIIPAKSGAFVQGMLTQPVRTNLAGTGRVITAAAATGQAGSTNVFAVNPNVLHHFHVSNISGTPTVGLGFPVTFTAQDSLNNTVTNFNGPAATVSIAAAAGAVTPTVSGPFAGGVRTETLTFTQPATGTSITVSNGGKSGTSNTFNVNVGGLHHFTINPVGTQTAGSAFNIVITAKDASENTVTSFNGTVTLSDNTGTLAPVVSGTFANGVRTQSVTITRARSGAVIFVNDGVGHLGTSSSFTVNPGALDHFAVTNTADADIAGQTAGSTFNIKIVALDAFDNIVTSHTGAGSAVSIANTTASISPAASGNFSNGVLATQSVTITRASSADAITVSGGSPARNGSSNSFAVSAGALAGFQIANIASPQTAGTPFPLLITAVDANGNTATSFTGAVNLSVSGGGTILPATSGNFTAGVWNGNVSISNAGNNRTITASNGSFNVTSNAFNVAGGSLDHFVIAPIGNTTAGQDFSVTVTAQDANNNNIAHSGTVTLSDNTATLTASPLVFNNQSSITITDASITKAQGSVIITASGSGKTAASNSFTVSPAALDHFRVTSTADGNILTQTAGNPFAIKIVAQDQFNNTVTSYNQPVTITDLTNVNFVSAALSNGVLASQNVTVNQSRLDNQITATGGSPQKSGASNLFNVNPGALAGFTIDTISDQATGEPFTITIRARDGQNNVKTDFTGTVTISDLTGTITPTASGAFINGVRQESVRITQTRSNNTISVSGGGQNGTSAPFNVQAVTIDHFDLSAIGNQTAGAPFSVTITAKDASNNTVTNFTGTVTLADLSNSIAPGTSNNFTAGVVTQNFTITKSFAANRITVTGLGKSNQSNAFDVSPAPLAKFAIAAITDQTAGQSFPIIITAQDQHDNTVTGFTGAVTISLNSGSITPASSSAFSAGVKTVSVTIPAAGNNRIISVADGAGHTGASNSFNVSASGLDRFVFSTIGTVQAGANFSFTITAKDASGNDVSFNGTVSLVDATATLTPTSVAMNGTSVTVNSASIRKKQNDVIITATGGGKSGQSNSFNVIAAPLARVKVVEGSSGDFAELGARSLTADQTLPVHAAGYDAFGNYVGDQNVDWLVVPVTANIGAFDPVTAASTLFSANTVGTGRLAAVHVSATGDSSGVITVTRGAEKRVKILSGLSGNTGEVGPLNLATGQFQDMHAASFDGDGNYVQDVPVTWILSGSIGTLSTGSGVSTRFTATTAGTGQITADHSNPALIDDATGTITVSSGTLARVRIVEGLSGNGQPFTGRNVTTDGGFTLHAAGYDAAGNYLGDYTVTWAVRNGIGAVSPTVSASTEFNPHTPGQGRIVAIHDTAQDDSTGLFTVSVGIPVRVKVLTGFTGNTTEVPNATLITGDSLRVHASAFDSDNNRTGDVNVTWRLSNNIGTLNPDFGVTTRFTATTAGFGVLTADHASLIDDATGTLEVRSGNLSYVKVVLGPSGHGTELGALSRTADDVVTVHAAGYDAQNNYLGDQPVDWSLAGSAIGGLNPVNGPSTTVTLTRPGTARIVANHASARDDSSGVITVTVGQLHHISILTGEAGDQLPVEDRMLTADESFAMHAGGFDADNNYIDDFAVDWSVTGEPIGALTSANGKSTTFNANKRGTGQIRAVHASAGNDVTGSITVTPGALARIKVIEGQSGAGSGELGAKTMRTDQELIVHAGGFDADDNYIRDESVTWSSAGTLAPVVNATGTSLSFQPTRAPASGTIRATHLTAGFDTTGTITVNVGPLHHVEVLSGPVGDTTPQGAITMSPGQTLTVHAGGFDGKNNYISDEVVSWIVEGNIGTLSSNNGLSTVFTAVGTGTGSIRANHPNPGVSDDNSGTITVVSGDVARIELRTAPNNGGAVFGAHTMTADEEVTIYAAGYDAGNNFIGDRNVTWSSTGTLAPAVNATGSSFTFSPTAAATGTIVGTYQGGISDATGAITVSPGAPSGTVDLTANPSGLPADGISTATVTSSVIRDSEGNNVGANRRFTVSVSPATFGEITDNDADPGTPGKQIQTNSQSRLNFTFRAGTTGGVATVNVNSGLGATGSVNISLGSLNISQISAPAFVTQGQTGVSVSMLVQNLGTSPIQSLAGGLTFFGSIDRTADYTVSPAANNPTSIAGNSNATLNFSVTVSNTAALENVQIDGNVSGTVNGTPVSKSGANLKDIWQVVRRAQLTVQSVSASRDTVSRGQTGLAVTVRVANNLGLQNSATARIDSVRLRFFRGANDVSHEYAVTPNGGNPTSISGNNTADFSFVVNVAAGASLGDIVIDAAAYGRDDNSGAATEDLSASPNTDDWTVISGNPFRIVAITPSQPAITAGMAREWTVRMQLQNLTSSNVTLDLAANKTFIRFIIGNDVTSTYNIVAPAQLDGGGTVLLGQATGTLTFRITQTGNAAGIATIAGKVEGRDAAGLVVTDDTNDSGAGVVTVQTQGTLEIRDPFVLSQSTITQNQTAPWTITARVTNGGQSALRFLKDSTRAVVGNNVNFSYSYPQTFADGDSIIEANETKTLVITVVNSGSQTGSLPLTVRLKGVELNNPDSKITSSGGSGTVVSQTPANLVIQQVRASQARVTAGQTNAWQVTVVVFNQGESQVSVKVDTSTNLRFRIANQIQSGYTAGLSPQNWLGTSSRNLAGLATDSLRFNVTATGTAPGLANILAKVAATESNSGVTRVANDNGTAAVTVQTPPNVTYLAGSLEPKVVNNNSQYAFKVRVRNSGGATVELTPTLTRFVFNSGSIVFSANLDQNKTRSIAPGDTTLFFVGEFIPANMPQTTYAPTIQLRGSHNGNSYAPNLVFATNELSVAAPAQLQVVSMHASQPTVTEEMEKDWSIVMTVANNGSSAARLDSVDLQLFNGGKVTQDFVIEKPAVFLGSNTNLLAPAGRDSLRFEIRRTGAKRGNTSVLGYIRVVDLSNGQRIAQQSSGNNGSFVVQSRAVLNIVSMNPSQPAVTINQTQTWSVNMVVRNEGESDVRAVFDRAQTNMLLSLDAGDYTVQYPSAFVGGGEVLRGGETRTLRFDITKTGTANGQGNIAGQFAATETNSGEPRSDNTQSGGSGSVTVQTAARLRIASTTLVLAASTPNLPYVNTAQAFQARVVVENRGEETADNVVVRLASNGSSNINPNELLIPGIAGGLTGSIVFPITASSVENSSERLTAAIISATARNTGTTVPQDQHVDNAENVTVQRPAALLIAEVVPSTPQVPAFSSVPWQIFVRLQNTGGAAIVLDPPAAADIAIRIDNQTQPGYSIVPPEALARNGNLILPGGETDTLIYDVLTTGQRGGIAAIAAAIAGMDQNNNAPLSDAKNGQINISTAASVRVLTTEPVVNNFFQGSRVGLVNTQQSFSVEVMVENTSLEDVKDVLVELVTNGGAQILPAQKTINTLPQRTSQPVSFEVIAATEPSAGNPENFVARILAATAAQSGVPASIFGGGDSTAQVRTQLPAQLTLQVNSEFNNLTTNQFFEFTANVSNRANSAEVDESGRLTLTLPDGFTIEDPGPSAFEQPFIPGQEVVWRLRAPDAATEGPLVVRMTTIPRDKNSLAEAEVINIADSASVSVVRTDLSINKTSITQPEGAKDGVVSTSQSFKIEAQVSFSQDLDQRKITLTLPANAGYALTSPATIVDFTQTQELSWQILAPASPAGVRSFFIEAEGITQNGEGEKITKRDTVQVQAVQRATLSFDVAIVKPSQDTSGTLTVNQDFKIKATLTNVGTAAAIDTAIVRLQLGETGVTTSDSLAKTIYIEHGDFTGVVEWAVTAPPVPTPPSDLKIQLLNLLNDENTGGPAAWDNGIPQDVKTITVRTDTAGTLFVEQPSISEPAGAADNILSTQQEFRVRALVTGQNLNLKDVRAELFVPAGFRFVVEDDKIQEFQTLTTETSVAWRVLAPTDKRLAQPIYVEVRARDANSNAPISYTSTTLEIDVVNRAELLLNARITYPQSVILDNVASIGQVFEITASLDNAGEAKFVGEGKIQLELPVGYTVLDTLTKTTSNGAARWQITARNTPSSAVEEIRLRLIDPIPDDENTGEDAQRIGVEKTLTIRTEEPRLTVTDVSAAQGIKSGPVLNQQKDVPVLALDWRNEGNEGSSNIVIKSLKFHVANREGEDLPPNAAVARVQVVDSHNPGRVLGQLTAIPNTNPLTLDFAIADTVVGGASKQATVLVDIASNVAAGDFFLNVRSGEDITAVNADPPSRSVQVNLAGGAITSVAAVLSSEKYEDSFYNFPNPFSPGRDGVTSFNYALPQDMDVEFRIFTMLGELVYAKSYKATDPQGRAGARSSGLGQGYIKWDGKNGNGDLVFNGVYMAVLKTSAGTVTTKVAVVK